MEITGKVFALGNSNALRLPRIIMEALALKTHDPITLEVVGKDELVIRKQRPSGCPSIRELMAGYTGEGPEKWTAARAWEGSCYNGLSAQERRHYPAGFRPPERP